MKKPNNLFYKFFHKPTNTSVITNPKSKWAKWVIGCTLATLVGAGISTFWALTSCQQNIESPINPGSILYEIKIGNQSYKITYGDFEARAHAYQPRNQQQLIDLTNNFNYAIISKLYQAEHEGFLKFQAIVNQRNRDLKLNQPDVNATSHGYDVTKSLDDLTKSQSDQLYQAKKSFQTSLGNNWSQKWLSELKTNPIYGFQDLTINDLDLIEKRAIKFMTTQAMKQAALARFENPQIDQKQWFKQDLNYIPLTNITYRNDEQQIQTITPDQAQAFLKHFIDPQTNALATNNLTNINQLAIYQTKSYLPQYRNGAWLLNQPWIKSEQLVTISQIEIPIQPSTKLSPLTITNDFWIKLFSINQDSSPLVPALTFSPIIAINDFQGASSTNPLQQARDYQLIKALSDGNTDNNPNPPDSTNPQADDNQNPDQPPQDANAMLGSLKIQPLQTLLKADQSDQRWTNIFATGLDQNLFQAKKQNPFAIMIDLLWTLNDHQPLINFQAYPQLEPYWNAINGQKASLAILKFVALLKQTFVYQSGQGLVKIKQTINGQYQTYLNDLINQFDQSDLTFLNKLLRIAFIDSDVSLNNVINQGINPDGSIKDYQLTSGYWSIYQLNLNTYLKLNEGSMTIFSTNNNQNLNQRLFHDLQRVVNNQPPLYDFNSLYEQINNEPVINNWLLEQSANQLSFKYEIAINNFQAFNEQFDDQGRWFEKLNPQQKQLVNEKYVLFQADLSQTVVNGMRAQQAQAVDQISDLLINQIDLNRYYEFNLKANSNGLELIQWRQNRHQVIANGINEIEPTFMNKIKALIKWK